MSLSVFAARLCRVGRARRQAPSLQRPPQEAVGPSVPAGPVTSSARWPSSLGCRSLTCCWARARWETLQASSLSLTDRVLREPSPPNNSPGGGDDPASGRLGKGLGQGGRESWSPSGGFRRKRAPALLFPFRDPSRLLWARVTHRPNGKTISTGECFFHIPQYREQHCDPWHFSTLMPEPRRAPSLL